MIIPPKLNIQQPFVKLNLNNIPLSPDNSVKYFGIYIDEQLNFKCHVRKREYPFKCHVRKQKIYRTVGILSKLKSFLPQPALLKLYYAFLLSHLLWFSSLGFHISLIPEQTGFTAKQNSETVISFYSSSCLDRETAKGPFGL